MLPSGTVTLLFTDIESSTSLLHSLGDEAYGDVLELQRRIMRAAIATHAGLEMGTEGDSFFVVFGSADDALATALDAQRILQRESWPGDARVAVRMGLHTGAVRRVGEGYVGMAINQAARTATVAHGGQIVASEATLTAGVLPEQCSWLSLGRHRLKDLNAAHEVFQLCHPQLSREFPPLRSLERVAHNLPIQPSSFLGRADELAACAKALAVTRLLTITGSGGTGKTRLAYQLAADRLDDFPDGVWAVELAAVADPELVPAALAAALGLRDAPGRTATETVVSHLRGRRALIVVDNCEHLVEPAAALVDAMLRGCAELRVVTTSREALRVTGESVWALAPLAVPAAVDQPLDAFASTDAPALFCERAAESDSAFALSADNAVAIARICRRVEGIPLAIELAAARLRSLPVREIADRLDRNFDVLSKGARSAARRQASVRATVAWSYDLLAPDERVLFARLGVFVGGFTIGAVESVCSDAPLRADDVLDLLDALVDKSLVTLVPDDSGGGRYRLLEPIRDYAAERLRAADDAAAVPRRHARYFADLAADHVAPGSDGSGLAAVHADLLAALDHLAATEDSPRHARMVLAMAPYWDLHADWRLSRQQLVRYLDRDDRDAGFDGACACAVGLVEVNLTEYDSAQQWYDRALGLGARAGDRGLVGVATAGLAAVAQGRGDYTAAARLCEDALPHAQAVGDRHTEAATYRRLGIVDQNRGRFDAARRHHESVIAIARELGDGRLETMSLSSLGAVAGVQGDMARARTHVTAALAGARAIGDRRIESVSLGNLGNIALALEDYRAAVDYTEQSMRIARELGDRSTEGMMLGNLGYIAFQQRDYVRARELAHDSARLFREMGERPYQAHAIGDLGEVAFALGEYDEARSRLAEAHAMAAEVGDRPFAGRTVWLLGEVELAAGQPAAAGVHFELALDIARDVGDARLDLDARAGRGRLAVDSDDLAGARVHLDAALELAPTTVGATSRLLIVAGDLLQRLGKVSDATAVLAAADRAHSGRGAPTVADQHRLDAARARCRQGLPGDELEAAELRGAALDLVGGFGAARDALRAPD